MKINLTGPLAKLLKVVTLNLKSVEDDSSEETSVLKVQLEEEIEATGSNPLPSGHPMKWKSDTVYVAAEDIKLFNEGVKEKNGKITYEGPLKLDVSKPKGRVVNGKFQITKPARLWLVSVAYNRRGNELRTNNAEQLRTAINGLFGIKEEAPVKEKPGITLEPVVETK